MKLIDKLSEKAVDSEIGKIIDNIRFGWNSYSFVFYIGGVSAILVGIFGFAGWASAIITLLFFYYTGKFKKALDLKRERRRRMERKKKNELE